MKTSYYKKNGFYDRLERLSDWIDMQISRPLLLLSIKQRLKLNLNWIKEIPEVDEKDYIKLQFAEADLCSAIYRREVLKHLYNRKKYWWMAKK